MNRTVALITGASSGMGREAALALWDRGVMVYAAARHPMPDLEALGMRTLSMDVTNEDSMREGVETMLHETTGRIDILINNAGYGEYGAIQDVPIDEARRQFEVNVFGAMRLTQLVLPSMIETGKGRIVNISSMGGRFAMALGGWYHATKYAIEALSDALRQEVGPLGIDVVIIEPGLIHTNWPGIAAANLRKTSGLGKYAAIANGFASALEFVGSGAIGTPAATLGEVIAHSAVSARPRTRYRKGFGALSMTTLIDLLPDRAFDSLVNLFLTHAEDWVEALRSHSGQTSH